MTDNKNFIVTSKGITFVAKPADETHSQVEIKLNDEIVQPIKQRKSWLLRLIKRIDLREFFRAAAMIAFSTFCGTVFALGILAILGMI